MITGGNESQATFKKCSPFINCITKIDRTTTDDTENLDLVIPMYNNLEYSSKYSETEDSIWFYSKDEPTNLMLILGMIVLLSLLFFC